MNKLTFEHLEHAFTENLWENVVKFNMPVRYKNFVIEISKINKRILLENRRNVETYVNFINSVMENDKRLYLSSDAYIEDMKLEQIIEHTTTELCMIDYEHRVIRKAYSEGFTNKGAIFNPIQFANSLAGLYLYPRELKIEINDLIQAEYVSFLNEILLNYGYEYTKEDLTLKTNKLCEEILLINNSNINKYSDNLLLEIHNMSKPYIMSKDSSINELSEVNNDIDSILNRKTVIKKSPNIFAIKIDTDSLKKIICTNIIQNLDQDTEYYKRLTKQSEFRKLIEFQILQTFRTVKIGLFGNNRISDAEKFFFKNAMIYSNKISEIDFNKSKNFLSESLEILWTQYTFANKENYKEIKCLINKNRPQKIKIKNLICDKKIDVMLFSQYFKDKNLDLIDLEEKDIKRDKFIKNKDNAHDKNYVSVHIPEMNLQAQLSCDDNILVKTRVLREILKFENEFIKIYQKYKRRRTYVIHIHKDLRNDKSEVVKILLNYIRLVAEEDKQYAGRILSKIEKRKQETFMMEMDKLVRSRHLANQLDSDDKTKNNVKIIKVKRKI